MPETETAQKLPPYVPFRSFMKLMDALKVMIPGRLDSGYMAAQRFSGSIGGQVQTACRFMGLVDGTEPKDVLKDLASRDGEEWRKAFEKVIRTAFAPIFEMNLETATESMLREKFKKLYGADGEVASKCIAFFVQACQKANIAISPLITKRARAGGSVPRLRRRREAIPAQIENGDLTVLPEAAQPSGAVVPNSPAEVEWAKFRMLVDKFPRFDPTWPDELKKKWFETYEQFMKTNLAGLVKNSQ